MTQATISILPNKGNDPIKCESYRLISLLTYDYNKNTIVHPDQTGFIRGRQLYHNLCRLFNIVYSEHSMPRDSYFTRHAQSFWPNRIWTSSKYGFGPIFTSWIQTLYSMPLASIRTNNIHSEYFILHRGKRQGCPLTPLLFNLAIEPLAIALWQNNEILGRGGANPQSVIICGRPSVIFIRPWKLNSYGCLKLEPHIPGCVSQLYSINQDMEGNSLHHLRE